MEQMHSDVMTLVELQKFLVDELADDSDDFERAFLPLTDGLGLESPSPTRPVFESPKRHTESVSVRSRVDETFFSEPQKSPIPVPQTPLSGLSLRQGREAVPTLRDADELPILREPEFYPASSQSTPSVPAPEPVSPAVTPTPTLTQSLSSPVVPPPVPRASFFRRIAAGIMDEIFVLSLCAGAFVITSRVLSHSATPFSVQLVADFSNPLFQRFAVLEFATLWLSYFAIGIGVLDMTVGMWVWGLRLSYGGQKGETGFFKKTLRVFFSFFFFAPIFPTLVLVFRARGRNLLDALSGTSLYRSLS